MKVGEGFLHVKIASAASTKYAGKVCLTRLKVLFPCREITFVQIKCLMRLAPLRIALILGKKSKFGTVAVHSEWRAGESGHFGLFSSH